MPRLGDKTFEQAAGFLRVPNGDNPLDASSSPPGSLPGGRENHCRPEETDQGTARRQPRLKGINASKYTDERFGLPTVQDILKELEKPRPRPAPEFKTATFADGVEKVGDLRPA